MPGRTLPTIPTNELQAHNSSKSCYVTIGNRVFDVTSFLDDHPGGAELILEHVQQNGHAVDEIMDDEISHTHTEVAYEILEESLIGFWADDRIINGAVKSAKPAEILPLPATDKGVSELSRVNGHLNGSANGAATAPESKAVYEATGMSSAADLSNETDYNNDYKTHQFLDLNKPLLMQIFWSDFTKEFYLEQVHRPRHYRGGESAPLFGNFLEPLSKTPWWMVPTIWLPCVAYGTFWASEGLSAWQLVFYWIVGLFLWTIVEYGMHRGIFHVDDYLPDHPAFLTLHFLLHGIHHYLPMDKYRLVMPPTLFVALAIPYWNLAHTLFAYNWYAAMAVFCGGVFGYICYDLTHYFLHHRKLPPYWQRLKKYHLQHHFADFQNGFGVTSRFWDWVFGTELVAAPPRPRVVKTL